MRIVFAGTPVFAVPTLDALIDAGHAIVAVYTQPDRAAGRGRQPASSAVKASALAHGLAVRQPDSLRGAGDALAALRPDVMVVVAYGLILPQPILAIPRLGCINVHGSLLPRWRGAAPIARAIEAGDAETGVSIMQMEPGLDTGPILAQTAAPIGEDETTADLEQRLSRLGADLLVSALARLERGEVQAHPQDASRACYAAKLQKSEAVIDWHQPALTLHRKIRAFNPRPVAFTMLRGETLRLWHVGPLEEPRAALPGTIVQADASGVRVCTGGGVLTLTRLQAPGGKPLSAREFLNGRRLAPGDRLGT